MFSNVDALLKRVQPKTKLLAPSPLARDSVAPGRAMPGMMGGGGGAMMNKPVGAGGMYPQPGAMPPASAAYPNPNIERAASFRGGPPMMGAPMMGGPPPDPRALSARGGVAGGGGGGGFGGGGGNALEGDRRVSRERQTLGQCRDCGEQRERALREVDCARVGVLWRFGDANKANDVVVRSLRVACRQRTDAALCCCGGAHQLCHQFGLAHKVLVLVADHFECHVRCKNRTHIHTHTTNDPHLSSLTAFLSCAGCERRRVSWVGRRSAARRTCLMATVHDFHVPLYTVPNELRATAVRVGRRAAPPPSSSRHRAPGANLFLKLQLGHVDLRRSRERRVGRKAVAARANACR